MKILQGPLRYHRHHQESFVAGKMFRGNAAIKKRLGLGGKENVGIVTALLDGTAEISGVAATETVTWDRRSDFRDRATQSSIYGECQGKGIIVTTRSHLSLERCFEGMLQLKSAWDWTVKKMSGS